MTERIKTELPERIEQSFDVPWMPGFAWERIRVAEAALAEQIEKTRAAEEKIISYESPCGQPFHLSNMAGKTGDMRGQTIYCVTCAALTSLRSSQAGLLEAAREMNVAWYEGWSDEGVTEQADKLKAAIAQSTSQEPDRNQVGETEESHG